MKWNWQQPDWPRFAWREDRLKGAFIRTGERRHTRYHLTIPLRPVSAVTIDKVGNVVVSK